MSNYELELDLSNFLIEHLSLPINTKLYRDSKLSDCGLDSLDMVDMIFLVEDRYDVVLENTHNIYTFGNLLDIIDSKLNIHQL
uniref:Carrier domain-containing protein n=1 Tax=viral metagenome TaxID=1070528 RepID=A0A6C0JU11_9ZZZZ